MERITQSAVVGCPGWLSTGRAGILHRGKVSRRAGRPHQYDIELSSLDVSKNHVGGQSGSVYLESGQLVCGEFLLRAG